MPETTETGRRLVRVTRAIKLAGLMPDYYGNEAAMTRGTYVHLALSLDHMGELNESTLDPKLEPYLFAWRRFVREFKPRILTNEEHVIHEALGYCGTPDWRAEILGREAIVDVKTGEPAAWHAIQTAAYAMTFDRPLARWSVYLAGDGSYKTSEHKDRKDFEIWKAALAIAAWRREHNLENEKEIEP